MRNSPSGTGYYRSHLEGVRCKRIIDLSVILDNTIVAGRAYMRPCVEYLDRHDTAEVVAAQFSKDLPYGQGWAIEKVNLSTHNGAHVDAPWHYHSTMDNGKRAISTDETPLDWFIRPDIKLDLRHVADGYIIQPRDIDAGLGGIGHVLQPFEIVVINTSAGQRYGHLDYLERGCGVGRTGTLHLTNRGIRVVGTDAWSWDAPFLITAKRYAESRDASLIWEGHKAGREVDYCQIEKLSNLEALPATGFMISCLPIKIQGASAGWTRAVAIIDE